MEILNLPRLEILLYCVGVFLSLRFISLYIRWLCECFENKKAYWGLYKWHLFLTQVTNTSEIHPTTITFHKWSVTKIGKCQSTGVKSPKGEWNKGMYRLRELWAITEESDVAVRRWARCQCS